MRLYKTQYSFRISGNRGYDSNRVRLCEGETYKHLSAKWAGVSSVEYALFWAHFKWDATQPLLGPTCTIF